MAKGQGKRSSDANEAAPAAAVAAPAAESTVMPDESAFAGLRQKIEQRLKNQNQNSGKGKKNNNNKAPVPSKDTSDKKGKPPPAKPSRPQDAAQSKKRDRNGEPIARVEKKSGKDQQDKPKGSKKLSSEETLRQEILAMGGTEEDLDLLAGVDSESEVEGETAKGDDDLRKQLASMLDAAGHVVPEDLADDEVEDVEDEEESDEEVDAEDSEDNAESSGPESDIEEEPAHKAKPELALPKEFQKLNVLPRSDWYNIPMPSVPDTKQMNALPRHLIDRVHELANNLLQEENEEYAVAQRTSASSSHKFYSTIMTSGTLSDKISALTLNVQESPLHNTKALETLIGLGKKRSRAQAVEVLRSLKDMFAQGTLLPNDRRLRAFANQPGLVAAFQGAGGRWNEKDPLPGGLKKSQLIVWAFENIVKDQFFEVLKILEIWCNDEIEFSRSRAVSYVYELLKEKPEQENNLLRLLVNKLGDPGKKIASRASYLLLQLMQSHPMMKPIIIKSVEEVLFRPGQSSHTKYYAIITLNQTILRQKEEKVAAQLLDIYFGLFLVLLKPAGKPAPPPKRGKPGKGHKGKGDDEAKGQAQDEEMREKLISGVLTGVNRAYPFTDSDSDRMSKHLDTLFRITHSSNFNTSIQALMLIQQLTVANKVSGDRFYRTLYESLLDPRVTTSSKQSLYLNLLYKALKNDLNVRRVKAFVKRLVQVLGMHQPSFICGIFYMIRELEKTFTGLTALVDQPEELDDDEEEIFRDVPDEDDEQPEEVPAVETKPKQSNAYDPRKRDPEHSNADRSCLWELLPFTNHFHPSVSLNASNLLEHKPMSGKPDLTLHTLTHFLDRFVYRTPKANAGARGASIMQPLAGGDTVDRLVEAGKKAQNQLPLNTDAFWKKKAEDVAAEDVFFHEYFTRVNKDKEKTRVKKGKDTDREDGDEEGISDNEDEIWKALVDSRPELEADESDDDLDMSDLESAFDAEDGEGDDESDGGVIFNDESDVPSDEDEEMADFSELEEAAPAKSKKAAKKPSKDEEEDSDDFDMDVSDDGAFLDSDEDLPSDMEIGGAALAEPEVPAPEESNSKKRRKLKQLPTFASADDYAALLADDDDGM
ncbi:hypothetical protein MYU51_021611 [Penicillium brevicompactum]|uniref:uncharacterized protein n=1 Tax=Penicillium brevicompactum TaxID=5074 RepID=UPI00253FEAF1|nr:uncharacterized protein N7506_003357 [Penicillium brevicompactum]KAJ5343533.1 hypothetical protein N7506_003357 [Penicillium brevicompactum]